MWRILLQNIKMPFYAVRSGRNPGIYNDWGSCKSQVDKFPKARYKKFNTHQEAEDFVNGEGASTSNNNDSYNATAISLSHRPVDSQSRPTYYKLGTCQTSTSKSYLTNRTCSQLKQQVDQLASTVNNLSEQLQSYEKNHTHGSKKSFTNSTQQNSDGSSRSYSTLVSSKHSGSHSHEQGSPKRFKHNNSGKIRGSHFDQSEAVTVYTDGSCFGNGQNGATAGIGVYWGPDHPDNVCDRLPGRQTNNRAEIHAAVKAIQQAKSKGVSNLVLKTDSQFCIKGITTWIHNWKKNGWKLSTGQPVVNKADFEELDASLQGINVQWVHVRGHRGEPGNEAADRLANEGAVKPKIK